MAYQTVLGSCPFLSLRYRILIDFFTLDGSISPLFLISEPSSPEAGTVSASSSDFFPCRFGSRVENARRRNQCSGAHVCQHDRDVLVELVGTPSNLALGIASGAQLSSGLCLILGTLV